MIIFNHFLIIFHNNVLWPTIVALKHVDLGKGTQYVYTTLRHGEKLCVKIFWVTFFSFDAKYEPNEKLL